MTIRLLERQINLLEYLTSVGAIFGDDANRPLKQGLQGIDQASLRLEACFSHEKRMEKIVATLPRTFQLLKDDRPGIVREFVEACPSVDIRRIENARQFHGFMCTRWQAHPPEPPYLRDVASCELAIASVRIRDKAQTSQPAISGQGARFRRHPDAVLLRCAYDIRPIFERGVDADDVAERRDVTLAIAVPSCSDQPAIFELSPPVFALLEELSSWTDRAGLGSQAELDELMVDLAKHGLLEVGS